jgi:uncharacterized cupin superfamily protein
VSERRWHVVNARDAQWYDAGTFGFYADFQQDEPFPELGVNFGMALPGQIAALYHRESHQECYFVLAGEGILIVEGEERPLKRWDYFHCPAGVDHICVAAGDGPFVVIAVGGRVGTKEIVYPVNETAARYGATVEVETTDPREAYSAFPRPEPVPFREEFLAG